MSKVIAIVNQKGGVAKTTTTNALGIGLANKGYKVLLIDLDPQGNLSMSLGVNFPDEHENTIAKAMMNIIQEQSNKIEYNEYINTMYGVEYFVGNTDLENLDKMLSAFSDGEYTLDTLLQPIKSNYDYIIIDCRPSLGSLTENAVIVADELIVPSEPQYFSTKGIQLLFDEIAKIKRRKNPNLKIAGILPTKVDCRTSIAREFIEAVKEIFNNDIHIFSSIPISTKIAECNVGKNIYEYDKGGKGVQAYANFVDEYIQLGENNNG